MVVSVKSITTLLLLIIIFLVEATIRVTSGKRDSSLLCIESEKQVLLHFKRDLVDPLNRLSSWVAEEDDCSKWTGIVCDNIRGHVKELRLAKTPDVDDNGALRGKINSSLLNMTYLTHLDLSYNDSGGAQNPSLIGSLVSLRYLHLTTAGFRGKIPHQLGNLSSLSHLGLRGSYDTFYDHQSYVENLHWLSGLSSLKYLDLDDVNLGIASDWLLSINKLPSLLELHLSHSEHSHIHPLSHVNFTSLEVLDTSDNCFKSLMPGWIFNLSRLVHLDLSGSQFEGPFPCSFQNMSFLKYVDLSVNFFNSTIPNCLYSFYSFSSLEHLDLHLNNFHGVISTAIENLTSMVSLDLSFNALEGKIPPSLRKLCNLESISLERNKYAGEISQTLESIGCNPNRIKSLRT